MAWRRRAFVPQHEVGGPAPGEYSGLLTGIELVGRHPVQPMTRGEAAQMLWNLIS